MPDGNGRQVNQGTNRTKPRGLQRMMLRFLSTKLPTFPHKKLTASQREEIISVVRPGDIILDSDYTFLFPQVGNRLFFGSNWIHAAIYIGEGVVVDAGRKTFVVTLPLEELLHTTGLAIYRPNYQSPDDLTAMLSYVNNAIGLPFNANFDLTDTHSFYCGQLVTKALNTMPHPIVINPITVLGKTVVPPASIANCPEIQCVWSSNPKFATNLGANWPTIAVFLLGSSYGHFWFGHLGSALLALIALVYITNSAQRKHKDYGLIN